MAAASDYSRDISFVAESVFGTTPGPSPAPSMKFLRFTGGFPTLEKDTFASEEVRSDGQTVDLRHGMRRASGDLGFELSYGAFDDWLQAALGGTWDTNVLKAGRTARSFTLEERHTDVTKYVRTTGVAVNTMSLTIRPNAMVTGTFGIVGRNQAIEDSSLGTPTPVASHPPFSGFVGAISEGGGATAALTGLDISLTRNIEPLYVVGPADVAREYSMGQNVLTGTATFLMDDESMLEKFANETESSISITLDGPAGGDLTIALPRIKYTGGARQRGEGTSIIVSMPFQALYASSPATNITITRIPA